MSRPRYVIGIDPDIERTGVALVDREARRLEYAGALTFTDCVKYMDGIAAMYPSEDVEVVIEDSDTSTNWHVQKLMSNGQPLRSKLYLAAAIGRSAGLCHATARHLREYAEQMGLPVLMQPPFRKYWKGPDGKITHEECAEFAVGLPKRTNQEVRDAVLLAWLSANIPIRIQPIK